MKKLAMTAIVLVALVSILIATPVYADTQEAVVGNDVINRPSKNVAWSNFVVGLKSEVFAKAGTVSSWKVYVDNPGSVGLLLLRQESGTNYEIVGSDIETVEEAGLNEFIFTPQLGGTANVEAGDILGLYIGTAKVDFEEGTDDTTSLCSGGNGCITDVKKQLAASQIININLPTLQNANYDRIVKRRYSVSANVTSGKNTEEDSSNESDSLGPLADLQGIWHGEGWNLIGIPIEALSDTHTKCESKPGIERFCVHAEPYCEILDISNPPIKVKNRLFPETVVLNGLEYDQKVFASQSWKPGEAPPECPTNLPQDTTGFNLIHGEKGLWLFFQEEGTEKVARTFSLARGLMALATGKGELQDLQDIGLTGGFPVFEPGENKNSNRRGYNAPYDQLHDKLRTSFFLKNPNKVLSKKVIKGDAIVLDVSTDNSGGGIASIGSLDRPSDAEGAFQMPRFKSTFWIENINDKENLQLQYSQTTDLEFIKDLSGNLILWPHVDVSTLCKDNFCGK